MNPTKTTPKDFFLHLGATIVLYTSIVSITNLFFSIINYAFPDVLASYFYNNSIAWPISMLIVLVPALYIMEWLIKRDIRVNIEKENLWIRRWRIYLTLFLTGATIIGDIIALINTYINGEIGERFVYKFLAILIISAIVFSYYFIEILQDKSKLNKTKRVLKYLGIIFTLISIIGGFIIVGSPFKQRSLRLDNQRVNDLSNIQWQIVNHWQMKGKLPEKLNDLKDSISGYTIPVDPVDKTEYIYNTKSTNSFELCADFALKSEDNKGKGASDLGSIGYSTRDIYPPYYGNQDSWIHESGKVCFQRDIDINKYPINKTEILIK